MPDLDPQDADLLRRLRERDPAAPAEFCERYLPRLLGDRRWVRPGVRDEQMIEEAAHTALLDFVKTPERYDPARLPLLNYLRMAARGDLLNLLQREDRHRRHRVSLEVVELSPDAGNDAHQRPHLPDGIDPEEVLRRLRERLPDERDRQAAAMMLDGVRETASYVDLYGLGYLPAREQREEVKRIKDRLSKVMTRLGRQMRGDG